MPASATPDLKLGRLNRLLGEVWRLNLFYRRKWEAHGAPQPPLTSFEQLQEFPFTTRDELLADQLSSPPLGTNLTFALQKYKHVFASSGTTRARLFWADTPETFAWVSHCSRALFSLAGIEATDRILLALNFSAASGSWIIQEGARTLGCCCVSIGASELEMQLEYLQKFKPSILVCAPATLTALGDFASARGIAPPNLTVKKIISFGKDGCDFEEVRARAKNIWHAEAFNRYGMTEAGSIAGECPRHTGMYLLDDEYIAETISPETLKPVTNGEPGELVLTNLGRAARPIIRYRTGDMVRLFRDYSCECGRNGTIITGEVSRLVQM